MGVFTRFRDIVSSNINAMLDRAEDPEKMIKLMIREMEDTLVELKSSCAGVMANQKKSQRELEDAFSRMERWSRNAQLAVDRGRDDLAREALVEKRRYTGRKETLEQEIQDLDGLVSQYQNDIVQLEERLQGAREKQRLLVQRHIHADRKRRAQEEIRRVDASDAIYKFEQLENRIERMEAEADLVNFAKARSVEGEIGRLAVDDEIERELEQLKASVGAGHEDPVRD
jgi:phage shock protein A